MRSALVLLLLLPISALGQKLTVTGGKHDATNVVIQTEKFTPSNCASAEKGPNLFVQGSNGGGLFVIPKLKAGENLVFSFPDVKRKPPVLFTEKETKGEFVDVLYGDRPVLRYVNKPHDEKD